MSLPQQRRGVPRAEAMGVLTAIVLLAFMAWMVVQVVQLSSSLRDANLARDILAQQVKQLGHVPAAGPPGSRGDPGQAVVGPEGPPGVPGRDAPTPVPVPGPSGPPGAPGVAGVPGPGSTIPGPTGPPGRDATGAPGKDGTAGKDGTNGVNGAPGQPPTSWTFTSGGTTYTCSRAPGFDPANPQYACTTPSPAPSPSSPPALLPGRRH